MQKYAWLIIIAASVSLFILTGNPLVASAIPYIMGGARGIFTAFWLRFADPIADRGRTLFWFYLAAAGWEAAMTAFGHLFLFGVINMNMGLFVQTMLSLVGGVIISAVIGLIGIVLALRRGLRVFIVPDLHHLCRGEFGMIGAALRDKRRFNYAIFVLTSSLFVPAISLSTLYLAMSTVGKDMKDIDTTLQFYTFFAGALLPIFAYAWCSNRIIASTPAACWPEQWTWPLQH